MTAFRSVELNARIGGVVATLIGLAAWALAHGYLGISHDAGLYTLQALSHLEPESLPQDVFLRWGSQDRFTLFSPIYAAAIHVLGVEPAAAALTLISQLLLLGCAFTLARRLMPISMAALGLVVLVAVPGDYGSDRIFTCIEPFLTPRMAAEALALAGIAAALSSRGALSLMLTLAAVCIHPVMACAGVAALLIRAVALPHPRTSLALAAAVLLTLGSGASLLPTGSWGRFDADWLTLITLRSPYLFLSHWQRDDWARALVALVTLAAGLRALPHPNARLAARMALLTVIGGFALTAVACDLLHLVAFTQLQPWRWQWLGTVMAALLLPPTLHALWTSSGGRATASMLVAAWIFGTDTYALVCCGAALLSLLFGHKLKPGEARWVLGGAYGMLAIALIWRVASNLQFTEAYYLDPVTPLWLRRTMSFTRDGTLVAALGALVWWLARSPRRLPALLAMGLLATVACASLIPETTRAWTARAYPPARMRQLEPFRAAIPPAAEIFWPEAPVGAWVMLDRPNYLSILQTSGMVFSRRTAFELNRRAKLLGGAIPPEVFMSGRTAGTSLNLTTPQLERACATGAFDFLVSSATLLRPAVASVPSSADHGARALRLYRCRV